MIPTELVICSIYFRSDIIIISSFTLDPRRDTVITDPLTLLILLRHEYSVVFPNNEHLRDVNNNA